MLRMQKQKIGIYYLFVPAGLSRYLHGTYEYLPSDTVLKIPQRASSANAMLLTKHYFKRKSKKYF